MKVFEVEVTREITETFRVVGDDEQDARRRCIAEPPAPIATSEELAVDGVRLVAESR